MFCPKCARENPSGNKFCNGCGASLIAASVPPPYFVAPPPLPPPPAPKKTDVKIEQIKISEPLPRTDAANVEFHKSEEITNDRRAEEKPAELPILENVESPPKIEEPRNLSKAFAEAESLSDDSLRDENDARSDENTISAQASDAQPAERYDKTQPLITAGKSFPQIENKPHFPKTTPKSSGKNLLFAGVIAAVLIISIGGFVGWRFMNKNQTVGTSAENKNAGTISENITSVEKAEGDEPPGGMVRVFGGEFMMGSDGGDEYERPAHRVPVKPFYIDKTEVTREDYKKFVDATGHAAPASWTNNNFPVGSALKPVSGVNWDDATAYASWAGKRLPTEEEWEFAARGTDGRVYPWGNEWKPQMANADNQAKEVREVGASAGLSPFGCFDMSGNAWEWTASDAKAYPNGKAFPANSVEPKILRGGFFGSKKEKATTTFRAQWEARNESDYGNTSFRCVKDAPTN